MNITIITGMSGAGKTQVMRFFEDMGFFCIDNMPPVLIPKLIEMFSSINGVKTKLALVIDVRVGEMITQLLEQIRVLKDSKYSCELLFLDADDETLVKRYKESRRQHPIDSGKGLLASIRMERKMLGELYSNADVVIETSKFKLKELYEKLKSIYIQDASNIHMAINVTSFGFKYGMPLDADLVYDVRCFPNPFYVDELKKKTGNDIEVQEFVMKTPQAQQFFEKLSDMVLFLIPLYIEEGKTSLTIAIGCTGGKHRSVTMANRLGEAIIERGYEANIYHRDIARE